MYIYICIQIYMMMIYKYIYIYIYGWCISWNIPIYKWMIYVGSPMTQESSIYKWRWFPLVAGSLW